LVPESRRDGPSPFQSSEFILSLFVNENDEVRTPWWLRVKVKGGKRELVNLTEMFPKDPVEVAAVKAKQLARSGNGVTHAPTALTARAVAKLFVAARGESYYLNGLLDTEVSGPNGSNVTIGSKPIDEVTTRDIKHAVICDRSERVPVRTANVISSRLPDSSTRERSGRNTRAARRSSRRRANRSSESGSRKAAPSARIWRGSVDSQAR
jgi:hypothetical protein